MIGRDFCKLHTGILQHQTKEFKHIVVKSFPPFQRQTNKPEEKYNGIMKCHTMFIDTKGNLKGLELSCKKCTISKRCQNCDNGSDALENHENFEDFENF